MHEILEIGYLTGVVDDLVQFDELHDEVDGLGEVVDVGLDQEVSNVLDPPREHSDLLLLGNSPVQLEEQFSGPDDSCDLTVYLSVAIQTGDYFHQETLDHVFILFDHTLY